MIIITLSIGVVNDMYAKSGNDDYKAYQQLATQLATQEDFDIF